MNQINSKRERDFVFVCCFAHLLDFVGLTLCQNARESW